MFHLYFLSGLQTSPSVSTLLQKAVATPSSPARRNLFGNTTPTKYNIASISQPQSPNQQISKAVVLPPKTVGKLGHRNSVENKPCITTIFYQIKLVFPNEDFTAVKLQ